MAISKSTSITVPRSTVDASYWRRLMTDRSARGISKSREKAAPEPGFAMVDASIDPLSYSRSQTERKTRRLAWRAHAQTDNP